MKTETASEYERGGGEGEKGACVTGYNGGKESKPRGRPAVHWRSLVGVAYFPVVRARSMRDSDCARPPAETLHIFALK